MFEKILVPLDGSTLAESAFAPALSLLPDAGGELLLLNAPVVASKPAEIMVGDTLYWPPPENAPTLFQGEAYLSQVAKRRSFHNHTVTTAVVYDDPASAIIDCATLEGVDLIVMTTHGYSGFTRWMLGSVTERVLRSAPCPILIIRRPAPFRHVLIPLDGSDMAQQALLPGLALADKLESDVTLLQVYEPALDVAGAAVMHAEMLEGSFYQHQHQAEQLATAYLQTVAQHHHPSAHVAVVTDQAAAGILRYAEMNETDVIVMATHGYTGLKRWVYGSVAEKVLRGASCAVLVVRS